MRYVLIFVTAIILSVLSSQVYSQTTSVSLDYGIKSRINTGYTYDFYPAFSYYELGVERTLNGGFFRVDLGLRDFGLNGLTMENNASQYFELRGGWGYVFSKQNRVQVPTSIHLGYTQFKFNFNDEDLFKALSYSLRVAPKFYITNKIAIQASLNFEILHFTETKGIKRESSDFSLGLLSKYSLGAIYSFN